MREPLTTPPAGAGDSAVRFRAVQDRAECTFARHSRLVGMPVHAGPDAYAAGRAAVPALRAFTARAEADRLDGFVIELSAPGHGATIDGVAAATRGVLAGILAADGDEELRGLTGAEDPHWWLRACGTRWFALVFAPAYGPESPRHTCGSASTFVLLQPVGAFDRRASPRGTVIAQAVREDIRARYAEAGRPYDAALAAQDVEALKFVWPPTPAAPPVPWWLTPPPTGPAPAADGCPAAAAGSGSGAGRAAPARAAAPATPAGGTADAATASAQPPTAVPAPAPTTPTAAPATAPAAAPGPSAAGSAGAAGAGGGGGPGGAGRRVVDAGAVARVHGASAAGAWDAVGALLRAAGGLARCQPAVDRETVRSLVAGLAGLGLDGPHRLVPLYTARPGAGLPEELRPAAGEGPPEEDVFRLALAAACPGAPWPAGQADEGVLTEAVRALAGRLGGRVPSLAAVAALHLLERLPGQGPAERRRTLRRLVWLTDSRARDAVELMRSLTGPEDPLVTLPAPAGTASGADDRDEEPLPLAGWHLPPCAPGEERRLGGRVVAVRRHRHRTFADLSWTGRTVQLALDAGHPLRLRPGDLLAVRGHGDRSRTGAPLLVVDEVLRHRAAGRPPRTPVAGGAGTPVVHALRPELAALGFEEMLSPVLTATCYGGASRPFTTRHASRNRPLYLRVTTELDLLRRLAEGRTRVYEIGPSFRNEPLRGDAVKEFAMLEAYAADLRLEEMAGLVAGLVADVLGDDRPARWTTFDEAFAETSGVHPDDEPGLRRLADRHGTPGADALHPHTLAQRLWRSGYRHRLPGVALVHRIPGPASPFIAGEGRGARRVWLSVDGVELAETSVNERDPDRLARRLARQFRDDPHPVHRDYRDVLETFAEGIPPCVGVGLGLDRLARLRAARPRPRIPEEYPHP